MASWAPTRHAASRICVQKLTDRWTAEIDRIGKHKEQEILEVG